MSVELYEYKKDDKETTIIEYDVTLFKEDKGFGIYFSKGENGEIMVEGFVRDKDNKEGPAELSRQIKQYDILIRINNIIITNEMNFLNVVDLLRSTPLGNNTLSFKRHQKLGDTVKENLVHAIQKLKFKLPSTINVINNNNNNTLEKDNSENNKINQLKEEQKLCYKHKLAELQKNNDYEKNRVEELNRLKEKENTKWIESCQSESEFCLNMYHSSDDNKKLELLKEYPIIMGSIHQHIEEENTWPVADLLSSPKRITKTDRNKVDNKFNNGITFIEPSPCLKYALESFGNYFSWTQDEIINICNHLTSKNIFSLIQLHEEIMEGCFEKRFQRSDFPRLLQKHSKFLNELCESYINKDTNIIP